MCVSVCLSSVSVVCVGRSPVKSGHLGGSAGWRRSLLLPSTALTSSALLICICIKKASPCWHSGQTASVLSTFSHAPAPPSTSSTVLFFSFMRLRRLEVIDFLKGQVEQMKEEEGEERVPSTMRRFAQMGQNHILVLLGVLLGPSNVTRACY